MRKQTTINHVQAQSVTIAPAARYGGLPVRTNLRAGLAWDEVDDQAISLFNKLKDAVSGAAQTISDNIQGKSA